MAFARYPTFRNFSASRPAFARSQGRKGFFARILDALHRSRRIQAARIISQSSHLVWDPAATQSRNLIGKK
jgi:hypothetical protein